MIRQFLVLSLVFGVCVHRELIDHAKVRDGDGHTAWQVGGDDCDDADAAVRPGLDEVCGNGKDDDCDGATDDDGQGSSVWFPDRDQDGFATDDPVSACEAPQGHLADLAAGVDCDDTESDVYPGHPEICANGDDDDCDGHFDDEGLGAPLWYPDLDQDGYATNAPVTACSQPGSHRGTLGLEDCDDADASVHPGAAEVWYDAVDQDCDDGDDFDQDGDDFASAQHVSGGGDCNDANAAVHPNATEVCFNGSDDDCDTHVDDTGLGAATWYPDLDQDGYATNNPVQACSQPPKHRSTLGTPVDCDDFNPAVKPGATELWYDGADQDCAGDDDYDRDKDTHRAIGQVGGGTDCDDTRAIVHPGATEVCNNGLDDDCDTTANGCEFLGAYDVNTIASITVAQNSPTLGSFGGRPFFADATGDGALDLVVAGYSNSVWIFKGPLGPNINQGARHAEFRSVSAAAWDSADIGDFNGDGLPDIAIGRRETEEVGIYYGPLVGYFTQSDMDVVISEGTSATTQFGRTVTATPDYDGDGHDELCVGAPVATLNTPAAYHVFDGPFVNGWNVGNRAGRLYGRTSTDGTGDLAVPTAWPGSGTALIVAANGREDYSGAVAVFAPADLSADRSVVAHAVVLGVEVAALEGLSTSVGDFNADGTLDVAMGAPNAGDYQGRVYVVAGPFSSASPKFVTGGYFVASSTEVDGQFGMQVAALDFDGDGHTDLAVGSRLDSYPIRVFYGPLTAGSHVPNDADVRIGGVSHYGMAAGDINSDGRDDLLLWTSSATLKIVFGRGR